MFEQTSRTGKPDLKLGMDKKEKWAPILLLETHSFGQVMTGSAQCMIQSITAESVNGWRANKIVSGKSALLFSHISTSCETADRKTLLIG